MQNVLRNIYNVIDTNIIMPRVFKQIKKILSGNKHVCALKQSMVNQRIGNDRLDGLERGNTRRRDEQPTRTMRTQISRPEGARVSKYISNNYILR